MIQKKLKNYDSEQLSLAHIAVYEKRMSVNKAELVKLSNNWYYDILNRWKERLR